MTDRPSLAIVLAAGKGTRMKSDLPKVLHPLAGAPMLAHVLAAVRAAGVTRAALVVAPGMDAVAAEAGEADLFVQTEQLGTAHAVLAARPLLDAFDGDVMVLYGDTPLLRPATLSAARAALAGGADIAVLGFEAGDPAGYGRLVMDGRGELMAIREETEASDAERGIRLCNSGIMAFRGGRLLALLDRIGRNNAKGEYFLTDAVALARADGLRVAVVPCAEQEVLGVNSRAELATAEAALQARLRRAALEEGATLVAPETVFLSHDTRLGRDVVVEPHVVFGPGVTVEEGARIRSFSHLEQAHVRAGALIGPYARLRPGADIGPGAHIGNFVEIKNAVMGEGAKANHLAYVGDAEVGPGANIGAGAITCNYDGFAKHRTEIGAGAFIGSNAALVAPVKVGQGAYVGSGSVIGRDVPADALALTRAPLELREGWAAKVRARQRRKKARAKGHES